ncbi:MAG TPA: adenylyl-sulfate kinase [Candidatus Didemnitutus sp.]|nr:adenylyl-sulfate kinase [Candidatus Didemnitutus sp.]
MSSDSHSAAGHVFWLFGLSGAGKTTLANRLASELRRRGTGVLSLDGDVLRASLCHGLGFSEADRAENLRRAACVARIALESSLTVIAAFITPMESHREVVRSLLPPDGLSLIHVDAPIDVCQSRDVKGLYARAKAGGVSQMTGVSAAFERPVHADLVLSTGRESIDQSAERLAGFARQKLSRTSR